MREYIGEHENHEFWKTMARIPGKTLNNKICTYCNQWILPINIFETYNKKRCPICGQPMKETK